VVVLCYQDDVLHQPLRLVEIPLASKTEVALEVQAALPEAEVLEVAVVV